MSKGTKIFVFTIVALVGIAFIFGQVTRNSFDLNHKILSLDEFQHFQIGSLNYWQTNYFNDDIQTLEELEAASDLIVTVGEVRERELVKQATKTTLVIDKVLKGDANSGDEIILYEPAYFIKWMDDHQNGYFDSSGYQLIQDGNQYILFLNHLQAPLGYKWSEEEKRSFLPTSQLYAKYLLNTDTELNTQLIDESQSLKTWGQIQDFEILTQDRQILNHYIQLKNQILTKYFEI